MAEADVGDDVFGDDPTVRRLEERAAELLGKEAGLFVASGTMGNLTAMMAHLGRGQEVIAGAQHHPSSMRQPGMRSSSARARGASRTGPTARSIRTPSTAHSVTRPIPTDPVASSRSKNTHAHSMAQPLTPAYTREVAAIARRHGVPLHIDGARFWNSVVAQRPTGVTARDLADPADTVTFCLSKGLGCPVGSVLVGTTEVIGRARRARKLVGGGMRQVGVLAAAGLVALADMVRPA